MQALEFKVRQGTFERPAPCKIVAEMPPEQWLSPASIDATLSTGLRRWDSGRGALPVSDLRVEQSARRDSRVSVTVDRLHRINDVLAIGRVS